MMTIAASSVSGAMTSNGSANQAVFILETEGGDDFYVDMYTADSVFIAVVVSGWLLVQTLGNCLMYKLADTVKNARVR